MSDELIVEYKEHKVLELTLNNPEVHNAFSESLIQKITQAFVDMDQETRLVVIKANGKSFCAGADLNWMKSMKDYSIEENIEDSKKLAKMFEVIDECPVPVLAKVNGHAMGGGAGIVAVCDYILAAQTAKFGFTEVKLGLIPAVISPYCIKKIGIGHARARFLSGALFNANTALRMGLIHEVAESLDLDKRFSEIKNEFLKAAPLAARDAKNLISSVVKLSKEEAMEYTTEFIARKRISDEGQEGMSSLLEKRYPEWVNND